MKNFALACLAMAAASSAFAACCGATPIIHGRDIVEGGPPPGPVEAGPSPPLKAGPVAEPPAPRPQSTPDGAGTPPIDPAVNAQSVAAMYPRFKGTWSGDTPYVIHFEGNQYWIDGFNAGGRNVTQLCVPPVVSKTTMVFFGIGSAQAGCYEVQFGDGGTTMNLSRVPDCCAATSKRFCQPFGESCTTTFPADPALAGTYHRK